MKDSRKTGLEFLGHVPWGTHLCLFYRTAGDLLEVLVPFFKAGLENNECCIWIVEDSLGAAGAKESLAKASPDFERYLVGGQLEVVTDSEWYLPGGIFEPRTVIQRWLERHDGAISRGCAGLRAAGSASWATRAGWSRFAAYEEEVDRSIGTLRMVAVCAYPMDHLAGPEVVEAFRNHKIAIVRRDGSWEAIANTGRLRAEAQSRSPTI